LYKALDTQQSMYAKQIFSGEELIAFWIPVSECPNVYIILI